jgi:hypothetical protein
MAIVMPATGEPREIAPANGREFTLPELQGIVGGYIEGLRTPDGRWVFVNEDGKRLDLPYNQGATLLMISRLQFGDFIVGDVVLCSPTEAGAEDPGV